jgi:acyl carrier protein
MRYLKVVTVCGLFVILNSCTSGSGEKQKDGQQAAPSSPVANNDCEVRAKAQIDSILVAKLLIEPTEITPSQSLIDSLGADELDFVETIMAVEERFKIRIADNEAERIRTVNDIYVTVFKKTCR